MVSFRRCVFAIAVLALLVGLAGAQTTSTLGNSSNGGTFTCTANSANPTNARVEGHTELLGDIVIQCVGGSFPAAGTQVATANITVALNNAQVTSRTFSNGLSEALLLIDEPGATGAFAATGPGTLLGQTPCATQANVNSALVGAGSGGCTTYVQAAQPTTGGVAAALCATNSGAGTCAAFATGSPVPNVFQGVVANNQIIFNGVPILPPVTAGLSRTFRITNIRGDVSAIASSLGFQGTQPVQASITISNFVNVQNPVQTVAFLFNGLGGTTVRNASNNGGGTSINVQQCNTAGLTAGAVLRFTEGFANAFKTRVFPGSSSASGTLSGAGTSSAGTLVAVPTNQNVPGTVYNGSESGFITTIGSQNVGLADFGTRLKATFNNVPTGISIFVSTTNINPLGNVNAPASSNTGLLSNLLATSATIPTTNSGTLSFLAGLVLSETSSGAAGGFIPLQAGTNNTGGAILFGPLPVDANGTATAVWEVLLANPAQTENAEFSVFYTLNGNPATNTPPVTPTSTVSMSFAPTFTTAGGSSLIPRFIPGSTSSTIATVSLCQTTLLFPFVNSTPGFDTGIAIANTSQDPFGTRTQSGTCTLTFFGSGAPTGAINFPSGGTTTTPIAAGTLQAAQVSSLITATGGFSGYAIAQCNFQLAHGYALFSDTGIRNWATGYLALILPTGTTSRNGQNILQGPGAPGAVEGAGH